MSNMNDINFERAMFMLESMTVDDLIKYWIAFGPCRLGPEIEHINPWWKDLTGSSDIL